ncbi:MAG: hypothetical protein QM734_16660 [Cyclobacteriaceae bacterium]
MKPFIYLIAVLILVSCEKREQKINPEDFKGDWQFSPALSFTSLDVSDSTIFVGNRVDTVFTVRYTISNDTLITYAPFTNQQFKNKIILLTKDTLVLDGIMNVKEQRHYSRNRIGFGK